MSNQREVVIVSACRTPVGRFLGGLSTTPAPGLGAVAVQEAVKRASKVALESIDEVLMGCVVPAGQGQAPARQVAIHAGLPPTVGATTERATRTRRNASETTASRFLANIRHASLYSSLMIPLTQTV